jgi:HAD superfamily hydrolase (TIGR01509 family)
MLLIGFSLMPLFQRKPLESVKAIIFDMDGTLIDSIDLYHALIGDIMGSLGMEMTLSRELLFEGLSRGRRLSDMIFSSHVTDRERIVGRFNTMAFEAFREIFSRGEVELIDGVDGLFEELRQREFSLAIATSSMTEIVVPFLKAKNLHSYFDCVIGRTEVPRLKPFPDALLKCVETLSVKPRESVYVGDSVIDIQAGKAAGMGTIGVLTGASDLNYLKAEGPDVILESVGDLLTVL